MTPCASPVTPGTPCENCKRHPATVLDSARKLWQFAEDRPVPVCVFCQVFPKTMRGQGFRETDPDAEPLACDVCGQDGCRGCRLPVEPEVRDDV